MTSADRTRNDTIGEAADVLKHHAESMPMTADYEAAIWFRAEETVRQLGPAAPAVSVPDHVITGPEMDMLMDLREHKWWSVRHWLAHWHERRFR
jgi:hypothetical protein